MELDSMVQFDLHTDPGELLPGAVDSLMTEEALYYWSTPRIGYPDPMTEMTEEINQTIWSFTGPIYLLYGISVPLGAIVCGIGILLYTGAKGSTIWKVGLGSFIIFVFSFVTLALNIYYPPLFAVGGTVILLLFIGMLWLRGKEHLARKGSFTAAAIYKLVGYIFMVSAAWFLCGKAAEGFVIGFDGLPIASMMNILILLLMGWVFLFLSDYKSRNELESLESQ